LKIRINYRNTSEQYTIDVFLNYTIIYL
jgi:hypothetical protein